MKLHHASISSNLRIRALFQYQRCAYSIFPDSTTNRPIVPPYPTRLHLHGKLSILSSLAPSVFNRSRSVFMRSQIGEEAPGHDDPIFKKTVRFVYAVWRLLRPFVLYETVIAAFAWFVKASLQKPIGQAMGLSILQALSALFVMACSLGSISGVNQIYDREIDDINKPFLPISSGDLSVTTAWALIFSMTVGGLTVAIANRARPIIVTLYCLYIIILGVLYSVPPFRLKRFAFGAHFVIASHGAILNLGLYYALKDTISFPFQWSIHMTFITTFMTLIGVVCGLTKDLSDIEGDKKHNIMTPAVVLGPRKTTYMGVGILLLMYIFAMATTILIPNAFRGSLMLPMHVLFSVFLVFQVRVLEKAKYAKEACLKFYMAIWNLRYAEYIMFLFM